MGWGHCRPHRGRCEVEELIGKRKRDGKVEYHVKWANWDPADSTWEARDKISGDLVSDYEEKHAPLAHAVARPSVAPAADKRPFVEQTGANSDTALLKSLISVVEPWIAADVARGISSVLATAKMQEWAERRLFSTSCGAVPFCALHAMCEQWASSLPGGSDLIPTHCHSPGPICTASLLVHADPAYPPAPPPCCSC